MWMGIPASQQAATASVEIEMPLPTSITDSRCSSGACSPFCPLHVTWSRPCCLPTNDP